MKYYARNWGCNLNSEFERLAPFLALFSAVVFGAIIWFVLVKFANFDQAMAAGIGAILGGVDYFMLRFVFNKAIQAQKDKR